MTYLDEVWSKLSEKEQQIMRNMQADLPKLDISFAVLDTEGTIHECDLITSIAWMQYNSTRIAFDNIISPDGREFPVSTVFLTLEYKNILGEKLHFETLSSDPETGEEIVLRAKTINEAKAFHQDRCLTIKEFFENKDLI